MGEVGTLLLCLLFMLNISIESGGGGTKPCPGFLRDLYAGVLLNVVSVAFPAPNPFLSCSLCPLPVHPPPNIAARGARSWSGCFGG